MQHDGCVVESAGKHDGGDELEVGRITFRLEKQLLGM
jgi:hypothetical protein